MDLNAIRKMQQESESNSDSDFLYTKEITEEGIDIRIMPPSPRMAGVPCVKVVRYWINKKPYICPSTFGRPSVIKEEIEEAKNDGDPELLDLVEDKNMLDTKTEYWWAVLHLDAYKDGEQREKPIIIGDKVKIFPTGPMIKAALLKVILSKHAQNGTKDGIADRVKGFNVTVSKSGKGKNTEYAAEKWPNAQIMPKHLYENIPDVVKVIEDSIKSDEYLRSVIRNYLYGEEILDEEKAKTKAKKAETKKSSKVVDQDPDDDREDNGDEEYWEQEVERKEREAQEERDRNENEKMLIVAKGMKAKGMDIETISTITCIDVEELEAFFTKVEVKEEDVDIFKKEVGSKNPVTTATKKGVETKTTTTKKPAAKVTETKETPKKVSRNVLDDLNNLD